MKALILVTVLLACASAPRPKAPDESHRVAINRTVPAEVAPDGGPQRPERKEHHREGEVEWR